MASLLPHWLKWYKKPSYVDLKAFANSLNVKAEEREVGNGAGSARDSLQSVRNDLSIPSNLTLERILNNKTCSPMSLYDFYMYLKHIEFSQENLEFYTWFKDYEKRFSQMRGNTKSLTSSKSSSKSSSDDLQLPLDAKSKVAGVVAEKQLMLFDDTQISPEFVTFVESLVVYKAARYPRPCCTAFTTAPDTLGEKQSAGACAALPSSSHEQRHQELRQIIALFLTPESPKELNIPPSMRKAAIAGIMSSDSPESLSKIAEHIYSLLKNCSHRNFVRLGINNGTFETLCMVTFVGILFTILGFLVMFLVAFASPHIHGSSRWRGLATVPFWFIGIVFLLAGMRGSCFLLLLFSRRQELPWERVEDNASVATSSSGGSNKLSRFAKKMMIFERKIRVKDVGLRRLQRKIVLQSIAGSVVGTAVLEVFFLCLPVWKQKI